MKNTVIKSLCRAAMIIIVQDLRHMTPKQGQQMPMIAIRLT